MQKLRNAHSTEPGRSTRSSKLLFALLACLATACFAAGQTPSVTVGSAPAQMQVQSETGAIFSDSMISAMTPNKIASQPTAIDKNYDVYFNGVRALHRGRAQEAERDAQKAIAHDPKFSDAYALAATAELSQRNFSLAQTSAQSALRTDPTNQKAYVILATADNYLAQYQAAFDALSHMQNASLAWWQVAYQRARAEAGLENVQGTLDWSNRAALTAPEDFAPLHLLHASALVAIAQYSRAADELETYLDLEGKRAPQRDELRRELKRLHQMANETASLEVAKK